MAKKINARAKGCGYERAIRVELRERFFPNCETSRYASKYTDDIEKGDLVGTGMFRMQMKATERTPDLHDLILKEMKQDEKFNVVFLKKNRKGEVIVMSKEDFYEILEIMKVNGVKL